MSPDRNDFGQNRRLKNISGFFRFVSVEAEAAGKRPQEKKRGSRDFPSLSLFADEGAFAASFLLRLFYSKGRERERE